MKAYQYLAIFCTGVMLSACSSSTPPAQEYLLLTDSAPVLSNDYRNTIVVAPVEVSPYLTGNGIVLVQSNGQVKRAKQNLWAEPLDRQLQRLTVSGLEQRLPNANWLRTEAMGSKSYQLSIYVQRFDATPKGVTYIKGSWQLRDARGKLLEYCHYQDKAPLADSGYTAMTQALAKRWSSMVITPIAKQLLAFSQGTTLNCE